MSSAPTDAARLRVVVADEAPERLERAAELVRRAGHEVVAAELDLHAVIQAIDETAATLAIVALHRQRELALRLIETINDTAPCPVVLLVQGDDPDVVRAALERGLDAYATSETPEALESAIMLASRRFSEFEALGRQVRDLEAGAARRAMIEQAKGVLMERHNLDERAAFELLRSQARASRTTLVDIAQSVLRVRGLLRPSGSEATDVSEQT